MIKIYGFEVDAILFYNKPCFVIIITSHIPVAVTWTELTLLACSEEALTSCRSSIQWLCRVLIVLLPCHVMFSVHYDLTPPPILPLLLIILSLQSPPPYHHLHQQILIVVLCTLNGTSWIRGTCSYTWKITPADMVVNRLCAHGGLAGSGGVAMRQYGCRDNVHLKQCLPIVQSNPLALSTVSFAITWMSKWQCDVILTGDDN